MSNKQLDCFMWLGIVSEADQHCLGVIHRISQTGSSKTGVDITFLYVVLHFPILSVFVPLYPTIFLDIQ